MSSDGFSVYALLDCECRILVTHSDYSNSNLTRTRNISRINSCRNTWRVL